MAKRLAGLAFAIASCALPALGAEYKALGERPAVLYDARSRGAAAYTALAREMLGRAAA